MKPLTKRELEAMKLVAEGRTNKEIAELLRISQDAAGPTVRRAVVKIMEGGNGATNRTGAVVRAIKLGLIDIGPIASKESQC